MTHQTLPQYDLQALTNAMMAFADASSDQILQMWSVVKLLAQGRPLSSERVASELQLAPDAVAALLRMGELDQDGNLVGLGLSLVPTPHAYAINGRHLYAWCAGDAITFSIFLKSNAVIESPDPISGDKIRLIATPAGVEDVEPSTAVVSHPSAGVDIEYVRAQFCNVTHFFASVKTASEYVSKHSGLVVIPVDEVFQLWKRVWEREPYTSLMADRS